MNINLFSSIYALTGSSGSGKSTASKILTELGAYVISLDELSRKSIEPDGEAFKPILELFGNDYISADGKINRKKLAELVFKDKNSLEKLESIIHPIVQNQAYRLISEKIKTEPQSIIIYESPLIFEKDLDKKYKFKKVIYISSSKETLIERIINRDGVSKEETIKRLNNQLDDSKKRKRADIIIDNSSSLEEFEKKIKSLYMCL